MVAKSRKKAREKKAKIIDSLQEAFSKSSIGVLTDYRGLTAREIFTLRRGLRNAGIDYKVVKNTLAKLAAEKAGRQELVSALEGPIAIAFGYGDIVAPAKALADYITSTKSSLSIKGGFLSDRLLTPQAVKTLSTLPSREILVSKVLGGMKSPIFILVSYLASPIRGFMGILQARIQQLEAK